MLTKKQVTRTQINILKNDTNTDKAKRFQKYKCGNYYFYCFI